MLRTILVIIMMVLSTLCLLVLYAKWPESQPEGVLLDKSKKFSKIQGSMPLVAVLPDVVKEINARNSIIKSISCDALDIRVWRNGHRYRLSGSLYYEKPKNFRMEVSSIFGKEVDLGANATHFWYWSRRDKIPGLRYAAHEDINRTRLKTPFNPMFLRATLGIEVLPSENCKVIENLNGYMLVYPRENASGQPILFSVFVNKSLKAVEGYLVSDQGGTTLAACEIQQRNGNLPSKILYSWYEENKVMLMELNVVKLDAAINESMWTMPNYKPKLNMAGEF